MVCQEAGNVALKRNLWQRWDNPTWTQYSEWDNKFVILGGLPLHTLAMGLFQRLGLLKPCLSQFTTSAFTPARGSITATEGEKKYYYFNSLDLQGVLNDSYYNVKL